MAPLPHSYCTSPPDRITFQYCVQSTTPANHGIHRDFPESFISLWQFESPPILASKLQAGAAGSGLQQVPPHSHAHSNFISMYLVAVYKDIAILNIFRFSNNVFPFLFLQDWRIFYRMDVAFIFYLCENFNVNYYVN